MRAVARRYNSDRISSVVCVGNHDLSLPTWIPVSCGLRGSSLKREFVVRLRLRSRKGTGTIWNSTVRPRRSTSREPVILGAGESLSKNREGRGEERHSHRREGSGGRGRGRTGGATLAFAHSFPLMSSKYRWSPPLQGRRPPPGLLRPHPLPLLQTQRC